MRKKISILIWLLMLAAIVNCSPEPEKYAEFKGGNPNEIVSDIIIPFEIQASHIIKIETLINSVQYEMIMDTGGQTFLELSLKDSLELETILIPPNNTEFAEIELIEIGDVAVSGMKTGLIGFNDTFKFDLNGMIGSDFLRFFQIEIDYDDQIMKFRSSDGLTTTDEKDHVMDIEIIFPYFPTVEIIAGDHHTIPGLVDTGLHFAFVFPVSWIENLDEKEQQKLIEADGYFARWPWHENPQNYLYMMEKIQIGDLVLENIPVIFGEIPAFLDNSVVLIGKYFLENYLTTIDYPSRQINFREDSPSDYSLNYSAGIWMADKEDSLQITGVWKDSPAFEKDLLSTDILIAVNGQKYGEITNKEIIDILMNRNVSDFEITVIKDGKETDIKLHKRVLFK